MEVTTEKSRPSVPYHFFYPCDFLEEAVRALFKCFGLDNKSWKEDSSSPGEEKEPEKTTEKNHQKSTPSSSEGLQVSDPSDPQEADPPSSTTVCYIYIYIYSSPYIIILSVIYLKHTNVCVYLCTCRKLLQAQGL